MLHSQTISFLKEFTHVLDSQTLIKFIKMVEQRFLWGGWFIRFYNRQLLLKNSLSPTGEEGNPVLIVFSNLRGNEYRSVRNVSVARSEGIQPLCLNS